MEFNLIIKKINDTLSPEEESVFAAWYNESDSNREYFERVQKNYHLDLQPQDIDLNRAWENINENITPQRSLKPYYKYAIAAAVILFIGIGYFTRTKNATSDLGSENEVVLANRNQNDIILTLADGSKVVLNNQENGVVASQENVVITKDKEGQIRYEDHNGLDAGKVYYNTLMVPNGRTFQIALPDGTKVWLNSKSSLKYPVEFTGDRRMVDLEGEAYFEVAKNPNSPFTVNTNSGNITVLGTHFNVNAYTEDQNFETTLVEGKVKVAETGKEDEAVILKPGQQARSGKTSLKIAEVDPAIYTSWKDGKFYFENENLKSILTKMARWYDFKVNFEQKSLEQIKFTGVVLKEEPLANLLNIISKTSNIKYKITKVNQTYEVTVSK
ncbi:FecR domain-containing protein [Flavobacterium sp. DGU38]|uniref:FecR domain-containing protein n=1 Tax=Flavobacterium calami TaxID=3139144 RepID=A0ABU9IU13_9FLAO